MEYRLRGSIVSLKMMSQSILLLESLDFHLTVCMLNPWGCLSCLRRQGADALSYSSDSCKSHFCHCGQE